MSEKLELDPRAGLVDGTIAPPSAKKRRAPVKEPEPNELPSSPRPKLEARTIPERRADELRRRYEAFEESRKVSSIQALEPSDSSVPTERPAPASTTRRAEQETLPAPPWDEDPIR